MSSRGVFDLERSQTFTGGALSEPLYLHTRTPRDGLEAASKDYVDSQLDAALPSGVILMWSGAVSAIPSGWALCNGANGTPDLRGRFIVGASVDSGGTNSGSSYNKGATGGSDSVTLTTAQLPAHDHSVGTPGTTGAAGSHSHTISTGGAHGHSISNSGGLALRDHTVQFASGGNPVPARTGGTGSLITADSTGDHAHGGATGSEANHSHSISSVGSGSSHENRPRYYALAYIMKL